MLIVAFFVGGCSNTESEVLDVSQNIPPQPPRLGAAVTKLRVLLWDDWKTTESEQLYFYDGRPDSDYLDNPAFSTPTVYDIHIDDWLDEAEALSEYAVFFSGRFGRKVPWKIESINLDGLKVRAEENKYSAKRLNPWATLELKWTATSAKFVYRRYQWTNSGQTREFTFEALAPEEQEQEQEQQ